MKKLLILFILLLVGCKSNKDELVCSYEDNFKENTITVHFKNDISVSYDKKSKIILENSQTIDYDNYDNVEIIDKQASLYVSENIDDLTKSEVKSLYEEMGYICK